MTDPQQPFNGDPAYAPHPPMPPQAHYVPQPPRHASAAPLSIGVVCAFGALALAAVPHGDGGLHEGFGSGTILTAAQVALGVAAALCFLTAAFRRRGDIASAANSTYSTYQATAPARAEAAQRTREGLMKAATAAAATAGSIAAAARENYEHRRAQRDVTPSDGNYPGVQDYPENVQSANTPPIADTPSNPASEFAGGSSTDDDGWDF